jgi:hypothetical protein
MDHVARAKIVGTIKWVSIHRRTQGHARVDYWEPLFCVEDKIAMVSAFRFLINSIPTFIYI